MVQVDDSTSLRDLARTASSDGRASEELLTRVRAMALKYARVRLGRFGAEDTAQDVAQEVCMAVLTGLPTYEDRGLPFEAFVYTITSRRVADVQRAAMRGSVSVADVPEQVDEAPTPEELAVVNDQADVALMLMRRLPPQQREILLDRLANDRPRPDLALYLTGDGCERRAEAKGRCAKHFQSSPAVSLFGGGSSGVEWATFVNGLLIHAFGVGLPAAVFARSAFSQRLEAAPRR